MMTGRVERLRRQSLEARPYILTERAELVTEAYAQTVETTSVPMRRALVFRHLMEHKAIYIWFT